MTHATMLNLGTFALAVPGAIAATTDMIQKIKKSRAKKGGRVQNPSFSDDHPAWYASLISAMIIALVVGFWLVLHRQQQPPLIASTPIESHPALLAPIVPTPAPTITPPHAKEASPSPKSPPQQGVTVSGGVSQHSEGDCSPNIVGIGNTTNCDTRKKYPEMTGQQQHELLALLLPFKDTPVTFDNVTNGASTETYEFQERLGGVFTQLSGDKFRPGMWMLAGRIPRGITANFPKQDQELFNVLQFYLQQHKFIDGPIPHDVVDDPNAPLTLTIAEP